MVLKAIRLIVGNIILFFNAVFKPKALVRTSSDQFKMDELTKNFILYELKMCPFCVKVRRELIRLSLKIEQKDVGLSEEAQAELMKGGQKDQVPCLYIKDKKQWLYESDAIIEFLRTLKTS